MILRKAAAPYGAPPEQKGKGDDSVKSLTRNLLVIAVGFCVLCVHPVVASASTSGSSVEVVFVTVPPTKKPTPTPKVNLSPSPSASPYPSPSVSPSPSPSPSPSVEVVTSTAVVVAPVVVERVVTASAVVSGSAVTYGDGKEKTVTDVYNLVFLIFLLEFYSTVRVGVKSAFAKIKDLR